MVWYLSTDCQKSVETKCSTYSYILTDGRKRVYLRRVEHFADVCVIKWDGVGGGSVLVYGGKMGGNKTALIVINGNTDAQTYINDVLAMEALPFIQFHGPNVTFMHDNARPHSATITRQFLQTYVLHCPVNSPDLNPIEQVWDEIERSKKSCNTHCK